MQKGFTRNFPPLKVLTEEQVEAIHTATLHGTCLCATWSKNEVRRR